MIHEYSWFDQDVLNIWKWMNSFIFILRPDSFVAFYKCLSATRMNPVGIWSKIWDFKIKYFEPHSTSFWQNSFALTLNASYSFI